MTLSIPKRTIVRARDRVRVHPLAPADAGRAVDTVFAALSPQSRYLRFHSPVPRMTAGVRARLVDLDGRCRAAVVAEAPAADGPLPVGIARLAGDGSGSADVAVAVADAWHRRGIGTRLLVALADLAADVGYTELRGAVLPHNVAMQSLVRTAFPTARAVWDGEVVQLLMLVGPASWTITHEDLMADLLRR